MSNCIILGTETESRTNGFAVSIPARQLLGTLLEIYNQRIEDEFIEVYEKKNAEGAEMPGLTPEMLLKFVPRISKKELLQMVNGSHPVVLKVIGDYLETLNEA